MTETSADETLDELAADEPAVEPVEPTDDELRAQCTSAS